MKVKLLKRLRARFIVEYYPSKKLYKACGDRETYHNTEAKAVAQVECDMINYARKYYEKYSKHIKI